MAYPSIAAYRHAADEHARTAASLRERGDEERAARMDRYAEENRKIARRLETE